MKTKVEIKSIFGKLLFEFKKEDNTVRDTVVEAVRTRADLSGANLSRASLYRADLSGANLSRASLSGADLSGADLSGAKGKELNDLKKHFWIIPEEGSFIAWKKCRNAILKIEIPLGAKRISNIKNRKCRAEYVNVLSIEDMEGNILKSAQGLRDPKFVYKIGIVKADSFDDDWTNDCSNGIHFFLTKGEAIEWDM